MLAIRFRITVREAPNVDLYKLILRDATRGTLLLEVLMRLHDLGFSKLGVHFKVIQDLLGKTFFLRVAHFWTNALNFALYRDRMDCQSLKVSHV